MKTSYLLAMVLLLVSLAGCTDLVPAAADPAANATALLATDSGWLDAVQTHEFWGALTIAAHLD